MNSQCKDHVCMVGLYTVYTLLIVTAFSTFFATSVSAQGGGTSIVIDVEPGVQLRCTDTLTINVTAQQLAEVLAGGGSGDQAITSTATSTSVSSSGSTWDVTITGLQSSVQSYLLRLEQLDICTVRALGRRNGNYVISSSLMNNTWLDGPAGSRVRVSRVLTRPGFSTGAFSQQFSIPGAVIRQFQSNAITLDFEIELDLEQAAQPGLHGSAISGNFTVTASAP